MFGKNTFVKKVMKHQEEMVGIRKQLDDIPGLLAISHPIIENQVEYEAKNNKQTLTGICIYNDGHIAIQKSFMQKGIEIKRHKHDVLEILRVVSGKLKMKNGDVEGKLVRAGETIVIPINQSHSALALEESWVIGITIPADPGYPKMEGLM